MIKSLSILLISATCNAQHIDRERDVFIDHEGNEGRNIFDTPDREEIEKELGEDAWQFLVPAQEKKLERYAKHCYRDFKGDIWTNWFSEQIKTRDEEELGPQPIWWFNLNTQRGGDQFRPVGDDAEPISAKELLGAMLHSDVKMVQFVEDRRKTRDDLYERRLVSTNARGSFDDQRFWVYRNVKVEGPKYETIWTFREQRFSTERINREVDRWREKEDNEANDEPMDTSRREVGSGSSQGSDDTSSRDVRDDCPQRPAER